MMRVFRPLLFLLLSAVFLTACITPSSNPDAFYTNTPERSFVGGLYGQVHVRMAGVESSKPPLVLLHPTPYSSQFYLPFIKELQLDRKIIAIDTPGYGDSDRPETPPAMKDYARNVIQVLDGLNIDESVDVLGYHTGTLIAAEMALTYPRRVNKAVLAGVPVYAPERLPALQARYAKPVILEADGSHLIEKWEFATQTMQEGLSLEGAQAHFSDSMGIDFLFSKNRLNVAISRAQALAIVVGNPNLAQTSVTSLKQMEQVNFFCDIVS